MADFKENFLQGKMSACQISLWGALGVVMLKPPSAANHFKSPFLIDRVVVYVHFIPLHTGLWLRKTDGY